MAVLRILLFGLLLSTATVQSAFEGYQLLSITPNDGGDAAYLQDTWTSQLDFWLDPVPEHKVTVLVPPQLHRQFLDEVTFRGMALRMVNDDLERMAQATTGDAPFVSQFVGNRIVNNRKYHNYDQIIQYLLQLETSYSQHLQLLTLTYLTHEGRLVYYVKLHGKAGVDKPVILIESGIHAREWIGPATQLYVIEKLLADYTANNDDAKFLLDTYDIYIVPVTNPDGYDYTHQATSNRLWRKNRRYVKRNCMGVDLNRNFDIEFATTGVSKECRAYIYPGLHAFSEPETANIRELFWQHRMKAVGYLSVHSYSQDRIANKMSEAIKNTTGKDYHVGTGIELIKYAASGSSSDWIMSQKPSIISMTYELRPTANSVHGFLLPPDQIVPTSEEFYASFLTFASEISTLLIRSSLHSSPSD